MTQAPLPTYGSDSFLAAIISSSSDAILTKNLESIITSWNAGAERIFGYTAEEVIGKPVTTLFPPEKIDEEPGILARIQKGEVIGHYETVRRRKDGTLINISLTVSPIRDGQGKIIGASKIARDITAQKREQERSRVTLSSIGDAVISGDRQGRVTFMNPVAEALSGWRLAEAIDQPIQQVFCLVDQLSREPLSLVQIDGAGWKRWGLPTSHLSIRGRAGLEIPIEGTISPIGTSQAEADGFVVIFRDVTEKRRSEISAARLAAIVESSDDAIISKNLDGIVTGWNQGAERIFGYTATEMIGRSIVTLLPVDRLSEEADILSRLQHGERVDHFQTVRVHKSGRFLDVSLTISPIRDHRGVVVGASKIARDISLFKEAQQKLEFHAHDLEKGIQERTAKLEETIAELEAFSYSLSHDMRAPIRAIQSFTELVIKDYGPQLGDGVGMLNRVISSASRMDRLIQDVLSFAKISRHKITLSAIDLRKLLLELVAERPELQTPKAKVVIEEKIHPVVGHDALLTQCLTNLLENAVKFVRPGLLPEIRIFTERRDGTIRISVQDRGIGIEPDAQARLFSLFHRLNNAAQFSGTGVGLAIVKRAAERMNGKVGVQSLAGQGSTFWIELPESK